LDSRTRLDIIISALLAKIKIGKFQLRLKQDQAFDKKLSAFYFDT
jgi:hypothetical protein